MHANEAIFTGMQPQSISRTRERQRSEERLHNVDLMRQAGISAEDILRYEKADIKGGVKEEFLMFDKPSNNVLNEMHNDSAAVDHIYGGTMSATPREMQIVRAWRPTPWGEMQLATGVVHRVHQEDRTVTVQFVPDQHRARVPWSSVDPMPDITPQHPEIRLGPNERVPTRTEIVAREENANRMRQQMGIAPDAPLPGAMGDNLRPGERKAADGHVIIRSQDWGIPAQTLDALRHRSIPPSQVTGVYGPHFYTNLYAHKFYAGPEYQDAEGAQIAQATSGLRGQRSGNGDEPRVTSHTKILLDGTELTQNLKTGTWSVKAHQHQSDHDEEEESVIPPWAWFLG